MNAANTDLEGTAALCEEQGVVAKAAIAKKALPNCNIVCLTGEELKADVSGYLQVLYDADPAAVGGTLPGEDFYWAAHEQPEKTFHLPPLCRGTQRGGFCFPVAIPLQKFYNRDTL